MDVEKKREGNEDIVVWRYHEKRPSVFDTESGIEVNKLYGPEDVPDFKHEQDLNCPGEYPYTRGIHENMYRSRIWTRRVFVGLSSPFGTNERFKYLINKGESGLILIPDVPTQMGIDPDHPRAMEETGVTGTPLYAMKCMEEAFDGISLDSMSVDLRGESPFVAASFFAQYVANAEERGDDITKLRGSMINDIVHQNLSFGWGFTCPVAPNMKICVDAIEFCVKHVPKWHPFSLAGYDVSETGANAIQEVAFNFGAAIAYIEAAIERGLKYDDFGHRIAFSMSATIDFFETIAKVRAARRVWAKIAKNRFGAKKPEACQLICSVKTAGSSLTEQQPINNIVRNSIEALAGVLGGTQSLDVCGYDEALALPSEEAGAVALNTQHIIAYETGAGDTVDPLGGSYYVEWLTDKIEEGINEYLQKIDEMGGMLVAEEKGWLKKEIEEETIRKQKEVDEKKKIIVGVNDFIIPKDQEIPLPIKVADKEEQEKASKKILAVVKELRKTRDNKEVKKALDAICSTLKNDGNVMRPMIEAYKVNATMGEILGVIREFYGYKYDPFGVITNPFV